MGIAAPGTAIVATNPFPGGSGQVDQTTVSNQITTIQGTSFAAPYVAGVAALIRARYPQLSQAEVVHRITVTAAHPAGASGRTDAVGYGTVDPVAALSRVLPGETGVAVSKTRPLSLPVNSVAATSDRPQRTALVGSAICATLAVMVLLRPRGRRTSR